LGGEVFEGIGIPHNTGFRMNHKKQIIAYLLALSCFTKEIFGVTIGGSIVDVYLITISAYGLLIGWANPLVMRIGLCWAGLLALSAMLLSVFGYEMDVLVNQGLPAAFIFMGIGGLLGFTNSASLLRAYRRVCLGAACLGILQFVASLGGLRLLMKESGRLDSLAYEPSHYAIVVAPAVFLALREMILSRRFVDWRHWVLLASLGLTFSVTGLILLIVCLVLTLFRRNGYIAIVAVAVLFFSYRSFEAYLPDVIRDRLGAFTEAVEGEGAAYEVTNLSVLSPLTNWEVAGDGFAKGRILGNGIGGHYHAYHEYYGSTSFADDYRFGTNAIGGHSLFIRSFSELGLLGLTAYLGLVFLGLREASRDLKPWLILLAIHLIGRMIKLGGFMEIGLPLFILAPFAFNQVFATTAKARTRRRRARPLNRSPAIVQ
jgi:hypothetical protein